MHNGVYVSCNDFNLLALINAVLVAVVLACKQSRFGMAFVATAFWFLRGVDFVFLGLTGSNVGLEGVLKVSHSQFHSSGWGLHPLRTTCVERTRVHIVWPTFYDTQQRICVFYVLQPTSISFCVTNPHDQNPRTWSILGARFWWILALRWCTCISACLIYNM